ncbi:hypothetical protein JTE90_004499 [Oedothorax gibbosus]|uniref:Uncharacterized protein n=1 Tax=Oedothorax gibbosus TaxID=931172 RepID=A0AAV6U4R4_9ARAC|nr:hypothetical protein JTE90_004499 [Oedothorax gibbosus]
MKLLYAHVLLMVFIAIIWIDLPITSATSEIVEVRALRSHDQNLAEGRRFLNFGPFRPFMRVLGMMGVPLLPIIFLRHLITSGAATNSQTVGGGAGMGSLGALGVLAPFGAGAGLGGIRPLGAIGGLRPLGALRPLGQGGLRPLGGIIANAAANAAQSGGQAAASGGTLFLHKRSTDQQEASGRLSTFMGALAKLEKVVDRYDLSVPDCQRLIVCELNRKSVNPSFGSFTEKLIQAFGVESRLERTRFTSNTKSVLKDFLKATRNGLQQRDCSAIYYKCPVVATETKNLRGKDTESIKANPQDMYEIHK